MENKDALLIRKMISLVESVEGNLNNSDETQQDVNEQGVTDAVKGGIETLAKVLETEKGLFSTLRSEIPSLSRFKTAEELINGLKSGEVATADAYKIIKQSMKVPEIAMKVKGLVSESPSFKEIIKKVFPKGGAMPAEANNFKLASETLQKTYGMSAQEAEALLKKGASEMSSAGGVSSKAIDTALSKRLKGSSPEVKDLLKDTKNTTEELNTLKTVAKDEPAAVSAVENAGRNIGFYGAKTWDKLKALKSRMSVKQLLLYGFATYGAYELVKGLFTSEKTTNGVLPACVANLPNVEFTIGVGDVVVAVIKDDIDEKSKGRGGVTFWPTGRVFTNDGNQMRGNYYCAGTSGGAEQVKASLSEQTNPADSTYVAKSPMPITSLSKTSNNIHIDWDGAGASTGTGTTPNPGGDTNYRNCNDFPFKFGCINPKIGEIQQCIGVTPTKGYFGPKTRTALTGKGYDISQGITQEMYDTIMAACGGGNVPQIDPKTGKFVDPAASMPKYDTVGRLKAIQDKAGQMMPNVNPTNVTPTSTTNLPPLNAPSTEQATDGTIFETLKKEGLIKGTPNVDKNIYYTGKTPLSQDQKSEMDWILKGFGYNSSTRKPGKRWWK